jgi:hypothetical protein
MLSLEEHGLGNRQAAFRRQSHAEGFILDDALKAWYLGLEDVRARGGPMGEIESSISKENGELLLRSCQGEPQVFVRDEQRALRHLLDHLVELILWKRLITALAAGGLAFGQQREGSGAFAAERLQEFEVVALGDAQFPRDEGPCCSLGQQVDEEDPAGLIIEGLRP